jgi:hypothetical protein
MARSERAAKDISRAAETLKSNGVAIEGGGAAGEDLAPESDTRWVHYDTLLKVGRELGMGPLPWPGEDFGNMQFKKEVRILPLFKEGPEFNLENALNHPEKIMESVAEPNAEPNAERNAERNAEPHDSTGAARINRSRGAFAAGYESDLTRKFDRRQQPRPQQRESPLRDLQAQLWAHRETILNNGAPLDAQHEGLVRLLDAYMDHMSERDAGSNVADRTAESATRALMRNLAQRERAVRAALLDTQRRISTLGHPHIRRRIEDKYTSGYHLVFPERVSEQLATNQARARSELAAQAVPLQEQIAEQTRQVSRTMAEMQARQAALTEEIVKTKGRLLTTTPDVHMLGVRRRIDSRYEDWDSPLRRRGAAAVDV